MKLSIIILSVFFAYCNGKVRIAGGEVTTINEYPFAAALLSNVDSGTFVQRCGGTILSTSAILSAASCFYTDEQLNAPANWRARVGSTNSGSGGTIYLIRLINVHTDFDLSSRRNDVAVLRTTFNIHFQQGVVGAAFIAGQAYSITSGQVVTAIGWGDGNEEEEPTTQLRAASLWVVDHQLCANRYGDIGVSVDDSVVCAGWIDVGVRGQCEGDTGSPLLDGNNTVIGVFSWAEGCAHLLYPGLNSRVPSFVDWVVSAAVA